VQPTSCIDTGSSERCHAAFWSDWRVSRSAAWLAIGDVEPRAVTAHERAERLVGHAGHRREHDRIVDPDGSDLDGSEGAHGSA